MNKQKKAALVTSYLYCSFVCVCVCVKVEVEVFVEVVVVSGLRTIFNKRRTRMREEWTGKVRESEREKETAKS